MSVLVVEPHPDLSVLMGHWLKKLGWQVTECSDRGALRRMEPASRFQLAVVDLTSPGGWGLEVATLLRQQGFAGHLVGWTTHEEPELEARFRDLGGVYLLAKPLSLAELRCSIEKLLAVA